MDNLNGETLSLTTNPKERQLAGVIGYFDSPGALLSAASKVREAQFPSFDVFSPYPIHGMDDAQGLERSSLPFITFAAGITGCSLGFILQFWTMAVDWPLNVGGKPFNSWPAFIPIMFECTILFAGLATVFGMFFLNRLPNLSQKIFDPRITQDRFAIVIEKPCISPHLYTTEAPDGTMAREVTQRKFDEKEATEFLVTIGAKEVMSVYNEGWF